MRQHVALKERVHAAHILEAEMKRQCERRGLAPIPIFADSMKNVASSSFGALPERLVILLDGRVAFIGGKGPEEYSIAAARRALLALLKDNKTA
jgi:type I thyroxine 5'-deiodinase